MAWEASNEPTVWPIDQTIITAVLHNHMEFGHQNVALSEVLKRFLPHIYHSFDCFVILVLSNFAHAYRIILGLALFL